MFYFDTSFLAPLVLEEDTSERIEKFFSKMEAGDLYISHWTSLEFASLIAREVRMARISENNARLIGRQFDEMVTASFHVIAPNVSDFQLAKAYIENFSTKLRAGDALHLAIAFNHQMKTLFTLDNGLLHAAKLLKVSAGRGIRV